MRPERILLIVILLFAMGAPAHAAQVLDEWSFEDAVLHSVDNLDDGDYWGPGLWHGHNASLVSSGAADDNSYAQLAAEDGFIYQVTEHVGGTSGSLYADFSLKMPSTESVLVYFFGSNQADPNPSDFGFLGAGSAAGEGDVWDPVSTFITAEAGYDYYMLMIDNYANTSAAGIDAVSFTVPVAVPIPGAALLLGSGLLGLVGWRRTRRAQSGPKSS